MSIAVDTAFIRRFQDHLEAKLLSEPLLTKVCVISQRKQVTLAVTQRKAPHLAGRNGLVGAGILINLPSADPSPDADVPGAQMNTLCWLDILVKDDISLVLSNGAGITAEEILVITWLLLNQWLNQSVGSGNMFVDGFDPIEDKQGAYGYRIQIRLRMAQDQPDKVAAPVISFDGNGNCTLTCGTAGATIYYTMDQSFPGPWKANPGGTVNKSQIYNGAFPVESGRTILAAAFIPTDPNSIGSDVWAATAP